MQFTELAALRCGEHPAATEGLGDDLALNTQNLGLGLWLLSWDIAFYRNYGFERISWWGSG